MEYHVNLISYADDFVLIFVQNTRSALDQTANNVLAKFTEIIDRVKLRLSPQKSQAMMFGKNLMQNRHPIFKICGNSIPVIDHVKYLGFMLDSKFNWICHIETVRENIRNFVLQIAKTSVRDKGLSVKFKKIWYLSVLEKRITYGSQIWFKDFKSHALRKLISAQRVALFSIIKPYRSVSNDALCVLAGVVPISISLSNSTLYYKVLDGTHEVRINDEKVTNRSLMLRELTYACPFYNRINNIFIIPHTVKAVQSSCYPQIYTDGSKMEGGTSAAFTVNYNGHFIFD